LRKVHGRGMCSSGNGNNHAIEYMKYWHKLSSFGEKIFDAQFSLLQRHFKIAVLFRTDIKKREVDNNLPFFALRTRS
ncbi:TPA: hypothetical protein ACIBBS_003574, partial [Salmonella enterica subsp. enterica serovar 9,12:-:-]